jgi:carbamoyltransferase
VPTYPNSAIVNLYNYNGLDEYEEGESDLTKLQNRRDLAFACQKETQQQVLDLILSASKLTGKKKVVLSGGYGLNCVANYFYLERLNEEGIELYVEPISNDGGTAIGAALLFYHDLTKSEKRHPREIYLGPSYSYSDKQISDLVEKYNGTAVDADDEKIVDLLREKNIVAIFQGRSENGPRALGNRSLLFDPTFVDGKDFVNSVKRREYFRPFAGSILEEYANEWFDLRGMESSPTMMYAVNCKPGIEEKIPSVIHVDGTCRIQTVNKDQNFLYYRLINAFKEKTGIPILFNTSFNLGGEPLVETLEDALWTLQESQLEYLYLPEYGKLISIPNWKSI